jgi:transposase InsO family protein
MAWKETCAVEERFRFIEAYRSAEWTLAELCRRYSVSRKTGYKWIERYEACGWEGLRDRPRTPAHHPNQVLEEVAEAVLEKRRQHPHWGPAKLRARLQREAPEVLWPAESTIGEMLKRAGLTVPQKRRRKATPSHNPLAPSEGPNQVWCADFKGWFRCGDGQRCDPLTITDHYSRFLLRCQALPDMREHRVRAILEAAFREYGMPDRIRTDNGEPFASVGLGGWSRLSLWWIKLGIRPERIPPGKPQHNGRHERMHRSLKQATADPPGAHLRGQQKLFDSFREEYNQQRPHEALQMRTPAEFYNAGGRQYPRHLRQPEYSDEWEVRRVRQCGSLRWHNTPIFVSKVLSGESIGLEPVEDGQWRVWFFEYPLGLLDERRGTVRKLPKERTS